MQECQDFSLEAWRTLAEPIEGMVGDIPVEVRHSLRYRFAKADSAGAPRLTRGSHKASHSSDSRRLDGNTVPSMKSGANRAERF